MIRTGYLIVCLSAILIDVQAVFKVETDDSQLLLVNAVFRHGDRTPAVGTNESFPNDPYYFSDFYPYGIGQLTNNGKRRAYQLGATFRKRYNDFLGGIYLQEAVQARSTSVVRSKLTLRLVLASLYPPVQGQRWNPRLNWQPINTFNLPIVEDGLLLPYICPTYTDALLELENDPEYQAEASIYDGLLAKLSVLTGRNMTNVRDLFFLYHTFVAESSMGLPIPFWAREIFPMGELRDATILQYRTLSYNTKLNRRNGGVLLHKMIEDMKSVINGTLKGRKINLYSAQELNVAAALHALGVYNDDIPAYCSAVIVELRTKGGRFYVKVLYHLGIPDKTLEMRIPGCDVLCPFEKFLMLRKDVIPNEMELQCDTPESIEL